MGVGNFAAKCGKAVVLVLLLTAAFFIVSCRTVKYVPVESVRTEYRDKTVTQRDSVFLKDSIYIHEKGDTVFMERWHTATRDKIVTDTLYIERRDSVAVPYPVEKELTRWQKVKQDAGGLAIGGMICLALAAVVLVFIWFFKR